MRITLVLASAIGFAFAACDAAPMDEVDSSFLAETDAVADAVPALPKDISNLSPEEKKRLIQERYVLIEAQFARTDAVTRADRYTRVKIIEELCNQILKLDPANKDAKATLQQTFAHGISLAEPAERAESIKAFVAELAALSTWEEKDLNKLLGLVEALIRNDGIREASAFVDSVAGQASEKIPGSEPRWLDAFKKMEKRLALLDGTESFLFTGTTLAGAKFDIKTLKGKVVLVEVWSSSCMPCVKAIPHLVELHKKLHGKGFDIVGVNRDQDPAGVQNILTKMGVSWTTLYETTPEPGSNPSLAQYGLDLTPTTILVGRDGVVRAFNTPETELENQVTELLEDRTDVASL
jgi:thiol-disulfide isomerase/thioredoxin